MMISIYQRREEAKGSFVLNLNKDGDYDVI